MKIYIVHSADVNEVGILHIDCKVFKERKEAKEEVDRLIVNFIENKEGDFEPKLEEIGSFVRLYIENELTELQIHIEEYECK